MLLLSSIPFKKLLLPKNNYFGKKAEAKPALIFWVKNCLGVFVLSID
jgi:hypothetical protein